MVPEYEARFMELLWYTLHLNTEKLMVRILMPQALHDAIQKALIAEEELISRG